MKDFHQFAKNYCLVLQIQIQLFLSQWWQVSLPSFSNILQNWVRSIQSSSSLAKPLRPPTMPPSGFRSFLPTWYAQIMGTISPGATSRVPTRLNMRWARRDQVMTFATSYRIILMATQAWGLSKFARAHFVSPSTGFIPVSAYYNLPFLDFIRQLRRSLYSLIWDFFGILRQLQI
jgi:hypothetical protein